MKDYEIEYEKEQQKKRELAQKIWNNPFLSGLEKFTKKDLMLLIDSIRLRIAWEYEDSWTELDIKDVFFESKCWLIETLDEEFFNKEKK